MTAPAIERARRAALPAVLALLVTLAASHAQSEPGADVAAGWIRPEEIPARAKILLRRLEAARPQPAAELTLAKYLLLTTLGLRAAAADALGALLDVGISEEDVYPRTTLPRGVPYALSTAGHGILGRVESIGMRASVFRSWNGAEVVVPNADLISSAVTNWTLSDCLCRIDLPVGVAYGTDPDQVVALLRDTVLSNGRVLREPQVLFKGFGESSLDFVVRAWTDGGYEQRALLTSELGLAILRALDGAGIVIPFPQRDVHVTSVSAAVRGALKGGDPED